MARVIWRNVALDEIDEAAAYIRQFDPAASARIATALRALGESLAEFPNRGRPAGPGLREMTNVPPYVLTYIVDAGEVHIVSIRHGARDPRN